MNPFNSSCGHTDHPYLHVYKCPWINYNICHHLCPPRKLRRNGRKKEISDPTKVTLDKQLYFCKASLQSGAISKAIFRCANKGRA